MDPVTVILTALMTGTAKAAGDAVPDGYKALKELIKRKFAGEPKAEMVLEEHESDPETYAVPLKKKLVEAGVDKDQEIIQAAEELLKQLKPEAATGGNINISGGVKGVSGYNISGGSISQGEIS